jgi:hypothetical protein
VRAVPTAILIGKPAAKRLGQLPLEDCRSDVGVDDDVAHAKSARRDA